MPTTASLNSTTIGVFWAKDKKFGFTEKFTGYFTTIWSNRSGFSGTVNVAIKLKFSDVKDLFDIEIPSGGSTSISSAVVPLC